jgi:hypothetical protein
MKKLYVLSFLFSTFISAQPVSTTSWLKEQWEATPEAFRVTMPSDQFPIGEDHRRILKLKNPINPILRNSYINQRYAHMSDALRRCLLSNIDMSKHSLNVSNWYTMAHWASKSAGEVIDKSRFTKEALEADKIYLAHAQAMHHITEDNYYADLSMIDAALMAIGLVDYSKTSIGENQVLLFEIVNAQIAIEMIPVGEAYLTTFCSKNSNQKSFWEKFKIEDELLKKAFLHYEEARKSRDYNKKLELILLASTEQVLHEQTRVHANLVTAMDFNHKYTYILPFFLTLFAGYKMGTHYVLELKLNEAVVRTSPFLETITQPDLLKIYEQYEVGAIVDEWDETSRKNYKVYEGSKCVLWTDLNCRGRFLTQLFRELIVSDQMHDFAH